jgi:hypothetical protein
MADAASWIDALDAYDQALAHQQELGGAYIERTSKPLADEWAGRAEGKGKVDPTGLLAAAKATRAEATAAPGAVTDLGAAAADDLPARVAEVLPGVDASSAVARAHVLVGQIVASYADGWAELGREADEVAAEAAGLAGGSDWGRFDALNHRLDVTYKGVIAAQFRAAADVDATLQKLCDAVVGPPDAKGADKPGTPEPAPPPPPPGSPNGAQNKQPAQTPSN